MSELDEIRRLLSEWEAEHGPPPPGKGWFLVMGEVELVNLPGYPVPDVLLGVADFDLQAETGQGPPA